MSPAPQQPTAGTEVRDGHAFTLVGRALGWLAVIGQLNRVPAEPASPAFHDVHMLVLALDHFDQCLRWLEASHGTVAREERDAYRGVWAQSADLRDALEHEEEYLAGFGRRRAELLGVPAEAAARGDTWSISFAYGDDGIQAVTVLSKQYAIGDAIDRAQALKPALRTWLQTLHETCSRPIGDRLP